ncbi:MAG: glycosyltransferase family 41 protein, partial [Rhodospirillaceae bacterium]
MDLAATFHQGLSLHRAGQLAEARKIYDQILRIDSANFDCLHFMGIIELQQGNYPEAVRRLDAALAVNTSVAEAFNNHGVALQALRRHQEAVGSFDRAIVLNPTYAEAFVNRGSALAALGRHVEAIASFDRAIAIDGNAVGAFIGRGRVLGAMGQYDPAIKDFDQAIALQPGYAEAHNNRGIALGALERYEAAVESFDRALTLRSNDPEIHKNRGAVLSALGRNQEAAASFGHALALNPNCAQTYLNNGIALHAAGNSQQALASFDRAIALNPAYAEAHNNRAVVLTETDRHQEALASCDRAIALQPDCAGAHYTRAIALDGLSRHEEAIESYAKAISYNPDIELVPGKRLHTIMQICRWEGIEEAFESLFRQIDAGRRATPPFPLLAMPSSLAQQRKTVDLFCRDGLSADPHRHWPSRKQRGSKLRIGYFSADFYNHATAHLAAGLFEMHDREEFEIIGFSVSRPADDTMQRRLNTAFDRLIDVSGIADGDIAAMARDLNIDIAIDLKGHTLNSRPGIFVHRAAPIQVSYLGYPGTMGMKCIDYLVADTVLIPAEHRRYYQEKIVRLPPSYQVNDFKRPISDRVFTRRELGLPDSGFVFCSFNNSYKITPDVFDVWMRLLGRIDGSVLWLLDTNATAIRNLRAEAQRRGIAADRLVFAERVDPS